MKENVQLYWEDVAERLIYAELDDYAWKLPEKIFRYKKKYSIYIYHHKKQAAFYSVNDSKKEAEVGFSFYKKPNVYKDIINMKRNVWRKTFDYIKKKEK